MAEIKVEYRSEVQAKAERLWDIMTDIDAWPEWQGTPFVKPITPLPIKEGSVFEVKLSGVKWKVTVTKAERPQKLVWMGKALGLKAVHEWEFQEQRGKTIATTRERVSGWTAIPLYLVICSSLPKLDERWLTDLKARAEGS